MCVIKWNEYRNIIICTYFFINVFGIFFVNVNSNEDRPSIMSVTLTLYIVALHFMRGSSTLFDSY